MVNRIRIVVILEGPLIGNPCLKNRLTRDITDEVAGKKEEVGGYTSLDFREAEQLGGSHCHLEIFWCDNRDRGRVEFCKVWILVQGGPKGREGQWRRDQRNIWGDN